MHAMAKRRTRATRRAARCTLLALAFAASQMAATARAAFTTPERVFAETARDAPCERVVSLRGVLALGGTNAFHERVAVSALDALAACPDSPDWRMGLITAGSHLVAAHRPRAALAIYATLVEREDREHVTGVDDDVHLRLLAELQFRVAEAHLRAFEFDEALDAYLDLIERPAFRRADDDEIREWQLDASINFALVHWQQGNAHAAERGMRRVARLAEDPNLRLRAEQQVAIWRKLRRTAAWTRRAPTVPLHLAPEFATL